jgi:hypothetical protein
VLVGEMRDLETIAAALTIAETGHLTLATLHTNSAATTITRIVDVFPSSQQPQIRAQLSMVLEGIMCQSLIPRANGSGRAMAMEILIPNSAVRNLIREDKIHQIYSSMQTGQEKYGMQTFNQALAHLVLTRQISSEDAEIKSSNVDELHDLIQRGVGIDRSRSHRTDIEKYTAIASENAFSLHERRIGRNGLIFKQGAQEDRYEERRRSGSSLDLPSVQPIAMRWFICQSSFFAAGICARMRTSTGSGFPTARKLWLRCSSASRLRRHRSARRKPADWRGSPSDER